MRVLIWSRVDTEKGPSGGRFCQPGVPTPPRPSLPAPDGGNARIGQVKRQPPYAHWRSHVDQSYKNWGAAHVDITAHAELRAWSPANPAGRPKPPRGRWLAAPGSDRRYGRDRPVAPRAVTDVADQRPRTCPVWKRNGFLTGSENSTRSRSLRGATVGTGRPSQTLAVEGVFTRNIPKQPWGPRGRAGRCGTTGSRFRSMPDGAQK